MKFSCGCDIDVDNLDMETVRTDCPAVFHEIKAGNTKGMFQLESPLCRHWCKEIAPNNISELSAVIALVRPGCLKAKSNGKSMTQHYADRKNGKDEVVYTNKVAEQALSQTFGILTYQEQAMEIARLAAGFTLQEADLLRKAIGKKLADEMSKVKQMFLTKAKTFGVVTELEAEELFENIEKSQRYSFNLSHSVAYAILGYWSAYIKTHFPQRFYTSWLSFAKQKQDANEEKRELVNDAKINGIDIRGPDLRSLNIDFEPDGEAIKFGIGNIKGIGEAMIEKLVFVVKNEVEPKIGSTSSWTWYDFLTEFSRRVSTTVVKALISSGSLSYMGISRTRMLYEFEVWNALTEKEQNWIIEQRPTFSDLLSAMSELQKPKKEGGGVANKNRAAKVADSIKSLVNPPHSLKDRPDRIAFDEEQLLGIAISFNQIEACDTREANTSCRDFADGKDDDYMVFAVSVDKVREITTKTGKSPGQKMAFLVVSDSTCSLDNCVIFPDAYAEFGVELVENNTVLLQGSRDNKKGSLIVNKVWSI